MGSVNPKVVKCIKEVLEEAEDGAIESVVIVALDPDGELGTAWAGLRENSFAMLGAVDVVRHEMLKELTDGD